MPNTRRRNHNISDSIIKELDRLPDYTTRVFTEFEEEMVRKYYPKKNPKDIARILGKKEEQIRRKAKQLGITRELR